MEADFWHERWARNEIAFHEGEANALLVQTFAELSLPVGARVFLPLCGKTRDIAWFLSMGHRVVGAELSVLAIAQLFEDLRVAPEITRLGPLERYSAVNIDVFVGDFFDLSAGLIGQVDAVYDRAALVAMPEGLRDRYAAHLMTMTDTAPQMLICFEYDQSLMQGPPFSVNDAEVARIYGGRYDVRFLARDDVKAGIRGRAATETVWLLS